MVGASLRSVLSAVKKRALKRKNPDLEIAIFLGTGVILKRDIYISENISQFRGVPDF
jgi:hypothetical protein